MPSLKSCRSASRRQNDVLMQQAKKENQSRQAGFFYPQCCIFINLALTRPRAPALRETLLRQRIARRRSKHPPLLRAQRTARGFTLFEVLVSILILALGMLAAASLQLSAIRTTQQSAMQTQALALASDIADRMRMNDVVMDQADASNPFLAVNYNADQSLSDPGVFCNRDAANCTPSELAAFEIHAWLKRIRETLPSGRVVICRDSTAYDPLTLGFKWACNVGSAVGSGAPVTIKIGWQGKSPNGKLERLATGEFAPQIALIVAPYSQ